MKNYIVSYHLVASAVRRIAVEKKVPFTALAEVCGVQLPTMSLLLIGSQDLRLSRLYSIADRLGVYEYTVLQNARDLSQQIADSLGEPVDALADFPVDGPPAKSRLLRAHELNDVLDGTALWEELLAPGVVRTDDVWRWRMKARMTRTAAAGSFGCIDSTIARWERLKFPQCWAEHARKVYRVTSKPVRETVKPVAKLALVD